jgi:serine O-acetyltransferase
MLDDPLSIQERLAKALPNRWTGNLAFLALKFLGVELPRTVPIGNGLRLPHGAVGLVVHESTKIGKNVRLYQGVTIGRADQYLTRAQLSTEPSGVEICDNAIIGAGSAVLFKTGQEITIGTNAVIGANSVVLSSVPAGEIWAGAPAVRVSVNPNHESS